MKNLDFIAEKYVFLKKGKVAFFSNLLLCFLASGFPFSERLERNCQNFNFPKPAKQYLGIVCLVLMCFFQPFLTNAQTFNGTTGAIPDPGIIDFTANVTGLLGTIGTDYTITNVTINIQHSWDSDLDISLVGPDGTTIINLSDDNGDNGFNYTNTVFTDAASINITAGSAPFTGNFQPEGPGTLASVFNGSAVNGIWTLRVADDLNLEPGTVLSWSITFQAVNPPVVLNCPVNATASSPCLTQAQLTAEYNAWLATATASGGCNGVLTNDGGAPPTICSATAIVKTVTFTYTSTCAPLVTTCQRTFTVPAYPDFPKPPNSGAIRVCLAQTEQPIPPVISDACGKPIIPTGPVVVDAPNPLTCEGTRTYTFTYTDCAGHSKDWSFVWTLNVPTLSVDAPGTFTVPCPSFTPPTYPNTITDACGRPVTFTGPTVTSSPDPITCEGTKTFTWNLTDCAGNTNTWSWIVTIERNDFTLPPNGGSTVACPSAANEVPTPPSKMSECGEPIIPTGPVVTSTPTCEGTKTYTWTYTDCAGHSHDWSYIYTIERNDFTVPANGMATVACPSDITAPTPPTVMSHCGETITPTGPVIVNTPDPLVNAGTRVYTYTYTDCEGNLRTWSFTYTVSPAQAFYQDLDGDGYGNPAISQVACLQPLGYVLNNTDCDDNCGACYPNNPEICDGKDNDCNGTIDEGGVCCTAPSFTACPSAIAANTTSNTCATVVNYTATADGTAPTLSYQFSGATTGSGNGTGSGSSFDHGATTVTITATNACGAPTCVFTVQVTDNTAPTITCPNNRTVNADAGLCSSVQTYTVTASDNCTYTLTRTNGLASGSTFPLGLNVVNWQVTDAGGNSTICSFSITVVDAQTPTITCPGSSTVNATTGQCSALVNYTVSGSDNCSGWSLSRTSGLQSGAQFPVGTNTVIWKNTDTGGNFTTCSFTVTVTDGQLPGISCPANITANAATGICTATVNYTTPTVSDNCSGASAMHLSGGTSGSSFNKGVNTVQWKATDAANNTRTCSFTITVNDNQAPVITCPANITANTATGTCAATVSFGNATATDNCTPPPTVTQTGGAASGSSFPKGLHTITFKATDGTGLTKACTFRITVVDNVPPTINCPAPIVKNTDVNLCTSVTTYTVTGSDNCGSVSVSRVSGLNSGSAFPKGTNSVVWRATDIAGNIKLCTFTITVNDTQLPTLICPQNINTNTTTGQCNRVVNYANPNYSDNCEQGSISLFSGLASGSVFPTGTSTVIWRAFDNVANSTTCSFSITVTDNEQPLIICPPSTTVSGSGSPCGHPASQLTAATATDNCAVTSLSSNAPTTLPTGATTITWTANDAASNQKTCAYVVTVNCGTAGMMNDEIRMMNDAERESASFLTVPSGQALITHNSSLITHHLSLFPNPASDIVVVTLSNQPINSGSNQQPSASNQQINNKSNQQSSGSNQQPSNQHLSNQQISIQDALGRQVWSKKLDAGVEQLSIDLTSGLFENGVYQVVWIIDNILITKSLVVTKR